MYLELSTSEFKFLVYSHCKENTKKCFLFRYTFILLTQNETQKILEIF